MPHAHDGTRSPTVICSAFVRVTLHTQLVYCCLPGNAVYCLLSTAANTSIWYTRGISPAS